MDFGHVAISEIHIEIIPYTRWFKKQTGIAWLLENYNSYIDKCFTNYLGMSLDEKFEKISQKDIVYARKYEAFKRNLILYH